MKIINSSHKIENPPSYLALLVAIESAGRTCYKSEDKITQESAEPFIRRIIKSGHESVIEHEKLSVRFICDRGVSHELVRHRLCSFSQESTRYCNYSGEKFGNELTFIRPSFWNDPHTEWELLTDWKMAMEYAENKYLSLIKNGASPQEARSVLPNSLKTELVMTANLREWRLILKQRTPSAPHPDMRALMIPLLEELKERYPVFFEDI